MKLVKPSAGPDGRRAAGASPRKHGVIDLGDRAPGTAPRAMGDAPRWPTRRCGNVDFGFEDIVFLPPIPDPDKILCVGLNYLSHILEGGREPPKQPIIFTRFANTQVGHGQPMIRPAASETFDFEGEMAVIIGKRCRHVKREDWESVVAGYSCYNDGLGARIPAPFHAVHAGQKFSRQRRIRSRGSSRPRRLATSARRPC